MIAYNFITDTIRLKLWYVQHLVNQKQVAFEHAMLNRVRIYWYLGGKRIIRNVMDQLEEVCISEDHDLELEGFEILRPWIEKKAKREQQKWNEPKPCLCPNRDKGGEYHHPCKWADGDGDLHYGCFWHEKDTIDQACLPIHFLNAVSPSSPFENIPALAQSLITLIGSVQLKNPNLQSISCSSWLNALPPFQNLFPTPRRVTQVAPNDRTKWWGQFRDRTGSLHIRNATAFRKTGDFPFLCSLRYYDVKDVLKHLRRFL